VLVKCTDPREDETVTVVTSCAPDSGVFERLSTGASSPQSTVIAYVNGSEALAAKTVEATNLLRDGCNDVDTALGVSTGNDVASACQPIAQRIAALNTAKADAGSTATWFGVTFPPVCATDPTAQATCLASCNAGDGGTCDSTRCASSQLSGTCNGTCVGSCTVTGAADAGVACTGECQGACTNIATDGGVFLNSCSSECNGSCGGTTYAGFCGAGCGVANNSAKLFNGECQGTCTGTCNGAPAAVTGTIPDGGIEGGIPNNADNNCPPPSVCVGWCSSNGSGICPFACASATFSAGICSTCSQCVSGAGNNCVGTCSGACTYSTGDAGASCPGICNGTCTGTLSNGTCSGQLACGQNTECNNACQASAAATVKCDEPTTFEVESVADIALYSALKAKGGKIGEALQMLAVLRTATGFVAGRQLSDFYAIGATGEVVRACVARGQTAAQQANATITTALNANPFK
jgi:hypothetical protein